MYMVCVRAIAICLVDIYSFYSIFYISRCIIYKLFSYHGELSCVLDYTMHSK